MAAASLVATAFGIIIIIVTAYVLAGGTLLTSEVVTTAQKDLTDIHVKMLGTSMTVLSNTTDGTYFYIQILNDGREPIRDYEHIDVFLYYSSSGWSRFTYQNTTPPFADHWAKEGISPDIVYPHQWDPGETLNMSVAYSGIPGYIKIVTGNGVANF
ncbi:MAG: hypothetical protein MUC66_07575 [Methanolinea sp.]|jgi:flagellar protein FlaF|nr:hypothetical protein [Methanolinea sp.]